MAVTGMAGISAFLVPVGRVARIAPLFMAVRRMTVVRMAVVIVMTVNSPLSVC